MNQRLYIQMPPYAANILDPIKARDEAAYARMKAAADATVQHAMSSTAFRALKQRLHVPRDPATEWVVTINGIQATSSDLAATGDALEFLAAVCISRSSALSDIVATRPTTPHAAVPPQSIQ